MGELTNLFSESNNPFLHYRAHENIFCKSFIAENLARYDCSADAIKDKIGIGLKTWVGGDDQKVAEFGKLKGNYAGLKGLDLVIQIAKYRNERIRITKNIHGIDIMIYHIVKRIPKAMQILEGAFDYIDIDGIKLLTERGNKNNTYFTDGKHTYHFSTSKNTLYMLFDDLQEVDVFNVDIIDDPYQYLVSLKEQSSILTTKEEKDVCYENQICLRLYSYRNGEKFVMSKSGLNQWNASGRKRNPNEIYIPYPIEDRKSNEGFFPPRDTTFNLELPDKTVISAKVCQAGGKAIMSNPNNILGEWLLREVFEVKEGTLITYEMLEVYGIDSVVFTKRAEGEYAIDFSGIGTYEEFIENS